MRAVARFDLRWVEERCDHTKAWGWIERIAAKKCGCDGVRLGNKRPCPQLPLTILNPWQTPQEQPAETNTEPNITHHNPLHQARDILPKSYYAKNAMLPPTITRPAPSYTKAASSSC